MIRWVDGNSWEGLGKGEEGYRVCWGEFGDGDVGSCFVCFEGFIGAVFALVSEGEFGEVAVVISLPTG
jgi:hypothetical protein